MRSPEIVHSLRSGLNSLQRDSAASRSRTALAIKNLINGPYGAGKVPAARHTRRASSPVRQFWRGLFFSAKSICLVGSALELPLLDAPPAQGPHPRASYVRRRRPIGERFQARFDLFRRNRVSRLERATARKPAAIRLPFL